MRFGEHGENRWLEVAPPGSRARLALNPRWEEPLAVRFSPGDVLHAELRLEV